MQLDKIKKDILNSHAGGMLVIVILSSFIYFQSFFYDMIFLDDYTLIYTRFYEENIVNKISNAFTSNYLGGHYYRPVTLLSFILNYEIAGEALFIYHLSNFLIHLITCLMLYKTLNSLGYSLITVVICSLLFAVNPLHINAVGWIAGRGDLLAGMFSIFAFFFFLNHFTKNRSAWFLTASFCLLLAILSKEVAVILPFLIPIFFFLEKKELSPNKNTIAYLLMVLVLVGFYYLIRTLLPGVHIDKFSFATYYQNLSVLPETVSKFFIPTGIKALSGIDSLTTISGVIILLIFIVLPLKIKRINKPRYYFGLTWFVLLLIPGMVFRTMEQDGFFYWDCRSYLPSIGLIFTIAEVVKTFETNRRKNFIYAFNVFYLTILAASTFFLIRFYTNALSYWNSVKADYPESYLPYVGLYNYYNHNNNFIQAETQLLNAIKIRPKEFSIRQMLNNFYLRNDETSKAFIKIKEGIFGLSLHSNYYISQFISLCVKLNEFQEIDNLIEIFSDDDSKIIILNEMIQKKALELETSGDSLKAQILKEKIKTNSKRMN